LEFSSVSAGPPVEFKRVYSVDVMTVKKKIVAVAQKAAAVRETGRASPNRYRSCSDR
jgi:hypothetical protein